MTCESSPLGTACLPFSFTNHRGGPKTTEPGAVGIYSKQWFKKQFTKEKEVQYLRTTHYNYTANYSFSQWKSKEKEKERKRPIYRINVEK